MTGRLEGKVAVVTGASKGIGAAIARAFGTEGASVIVNYSTSKTDADHVVADITATGSHAIAIQANMRDETDIERLFTTAHDEYGDLDILMNNAGIYDFFPYDAITVETFRRFMELNVLGDMLTVKHAVAHFGPSGGSIINMASTIPTFAPPGSSMYTATKAAIDGLTRAYSNELADKNIRVNAIKAGVVETEGVNAGGFMNDEFSEFILSRTPLGRVGAATDIAPAAVYLASDESAWTTGEFITLAGGHR